MTVVAQLPYHGKAVGRIGARIWLASQGTRFQAIAGHNEGETMEINPDPRRVAVEGMKPEIDGGRFPIKRVAGETVVVEADVFTDGHEAVSCALLHRKEGAADWIEVPMTALGNDRWQAEFAVPQTARYHYT